MNVTPKGPFYRDYWIPISFVLTMVVVMLLALFMRPSTKTRLSWVKPGHSRFYVRAVLGAPDRAAQITGLEGLQPFLRDRQAFELWYYRGAGGVFFVDEDGSSPDQWRVKGAFAE
jgi:hypothetical protein